MLDLVSNNLVPTPGADENSSLGALSALQRKLTGKFSEEYDAAVGDRTSARESLDEYYRTAMDELKKPTQDNSWLRVAIEAGKPSLPWERPLLNAAQAAMDEQNRVAKMDTTNRLAASKLGAEWQSSRVEDASKNVENLRKALARGSGVGGGATGKWVSSKDDQGNLYWTNNVTGEQKVVQASKLPLWKAAQQKGYEIAVAQQMEDPEGYSVNYANSMVTSSPQGVVPQAANQLPTAPLGVGASQTAPQTTSPSGRVGVLPANLPPEVQEELERQILRLQANPENAKLRENVLRRLKELAAAYPNANAYASQPDGSPPQAGASATTGLKYRDKPVAAMEEETAKETGKSLGKMFEEYQTASHNSSSFKLYLDEMKNLFSNPNLPEGKFGETLQDVRSGMVSLGLFDKDEAKNVADGDMLMALGGKLSLLTRTAEGGNLMPGAMSDFEQKILRSLSPGLNQTQEGRLKLIDFLNDMANTRIRIAKEASAAAGERGILPPSWFARRDRVLKEEQARLAFKAAKLRSVQ